MATQYWKDITNRIGCEVPKQITWVLKTSPDSNVCSGCCCEAFYDPDATPEQLVALMDSNLDSYTFCYGEMKLKVRLCGKPRRKEQNIRVAEYHLIDGEWKERLPTADNSITGVMPIRSKKPLKI